MKGKGRGRKKKRGGRLAIERQDSKVSQLFSFSQETRKKRKFQTALKLERRKRRFARAIQKTAGGSLLITVHPGRQRLTGKGSKVPELIKEGRRKKKKEK